MIGEKKRNRHRTRCRPKKPALKYSKAIVITVIALNLLFALGAFYLFLKTEKEPTVLTGAWFAFTTGELWMLANIRKQDQKIKQSNETKENEESEY